MQAWVVAESEDEGASADDYEEEEEQLEAEERFEALYNFRFQVLLLYNVLHGLPMLAPRETAQTHFDWHLQLSLSFPPPSLPPFLTPLLSPYACTYLCVGV